MTKVVDEITRKLTTLPDGDLSILQKNLRNEITKRDIFPYAESASLSETLQDGQGGFIICFHLTQPYATLPFRKKLLEKEKADRLEYRVRDLLVSYDVPFLDHMVMPTGKDHALNFYIPCEPSEMDSIRPKLESAIAQINNELSSNRNRGGASR